MFDRILVPTDGSEYAESAADTAFELADAHDATVHVISVADPGPLGDLRLPGDATSAEDAIRSRADEFASRLTERAEADGLDVTSVVRTGPPEHEILDYAAEIDADVIVMGTRGRGGVHRMALGSVTDHVIRVGEPPVLVAEREPVSE